MHDRERQVEDSVGRNGRDRVLDAAYTLFTRHGLRAVGVDTVIKKAGVAKMTLYRNFATKTVLIESVLERREDLWTAWLFEEAAHRAGDPAGQLLALFDVLDGWIRLDDFEGCTFITSMLEAWPDDRVVLGLAREHLMAIHRRVRALAEQAESADPDRLADAWDVLMRGAIVAAQGGNREAAQCARDLATAYLAQRSTSTIPDSCGTATSKLPGNVV